MATGRVVELSPDGGIVISLGSADNVAVGDRIRLSESLEESLGDAQTVTTLKPLAVGTVTAVSAGRAKVSLGLNERVPVGAVATPTTEPLTGSRVGPPRAHSLWEFEGMARPFAALDELGGGLLVSGSVGYRFQSNLRVFAFVDPIALADVENSRSLFSGLGAAAVSYDSKFIEMGFGIGGQTVNSTSFGLEPGSGFSLALLTRLGARDGLNLTALTNVVLFHKEFQFGWLNIHGQIPVGTGYWLLLGGAGGNVGTAYGEIGLRVLLNGNGGSGSSFLTATAGGAALFENGACTTDSNGFFIDCENSETYGGPMIGLGGEWRL